MITGLFMSCFLIGALWFLIGIGDAIVFRDRMQEAADHTAFTSAALHAKGMNFISACNLVLLALVAVHIVLGIIHDILLAVCIASLGFGCGAWIAARKIYTGYFQFLKPAAKAIHVAEMAAAYGYPYVGFAKGYEVGRKYRGRSKEDPSVLALSSSMIPGFASGSSKAGLPVEPKPMKDVCKKMANSIFDMGIRAAGKSPSGGGKAMGTFRNIASGGVQFRYCNDLGAATGRKGQMDLDGYLGKGNDGVEEANKGIDAYNANRDGGDPFKERIGKAKTGGGGGGGGLDPGFDSFWGEDGPLYVWGAAQNGNEWMQIWAMNVPPKFEDPSESRVGIAARRVGVTTQATTFGYFAQAEFFFDCENKWGDDDCNYDANASYSVKWRARLRRLDLPMVGNFAGGWLGELVVNLDRYKDMRKWLADNSLFDKLRRGAGAGPLQVSVVRNVLDGMMKDSDAFVRREANGAGGLLNAPPFTGVYH